MLVCGTVWPCVLTTFIYNMITFNLILTGIGGEEYSGYADYIRWIVVNLIALLATLLYCKKMKKKFPPPAPIAEPETELESLKDVRSK